MLHRFYYLIGVLISGIKSVSIFEDLNYLMEAIAGHMLQVSDIQVVLPLHQFTIGMLLLRLEDDEDEEELVLSPLNDGSQESDAHFLCLRLFLLFLEDLRGCFGQGRELVELLGQEVGQVLVQLLQDSQDLRRKLLVVKR